MLQLSESLQMLRDAEVGMLQHVDLQRPKLRRQSSQHAWDHCRIPLMVISKGVAESDLTQAHRSFGMIQSIGIQRQVGRQHLQLHGHQPPEGAENVDEGIRTAVVHVPCEPREMMRQTAAAGARGTRNNDSSIGGDGC